MGCNWLRDNKCPLSVIWGASADAVAPCKKPTTDQNYLPEDYCIYPNLSLKDIMGMPQLSIHQKEILNNMWAQQVASETSKTIVASLDKSVIIQPFTKRTKKGEMITGIEFHPSRIQSYTVWLDRKVEGFEYTRAKANCRLIDAIIFKEDADAARRAKSQNK